CDHGYDFISLNARLRGLVHSAAPIFQAMFSFVLSFGENRIGLGEGRDHRAPLALRQNTTGLLCRSGNVLFFHPAMVIVRIHSVSAVRSAAIQNVVISFSTVMAASITCIFR